LLLLRGRLAFRRVFSFTISAVLSIPLAVACLLAEFFKFVFFNVAELVIRTL
jgi:hypothetical protein